ILCSTGVVAVLDDPVLPLDCLGETPTGQHFALVSLPRVRPSTTRQIPDCLTGRDRIAKFELSACRLTHLTTACSPKQLAARVRRQRPAALARSHSARSAAYLTGSERQRSPSVLNGVGGPSTSRCFDLQLATISLLLPLRLGLLLLCSNSFRACL